MNVKIFTSNLLLLGLFLTGCGLIQSKQLSPIDDYETWQVKPNSVYDGDTLRLVKKNEEVKIRFACVDSPEKKQPGGIESRDYLRAVLAQGNNQVKVNPITTDRYGRTVAELWVKVNNKWQLVQQKQAEQGWVWGYEQYKSDCPSWDAIAAAQAQAQQAKRGIWKGNPEEPWLWRKRNK